MSFGGLKQEFLNRWRALYWRGYIMSSEIETVFLRKWFGNFLIREIYKNVKEKLYEEISKIFILLKLTVGYPLNKLICYLLNEIFHQKSQNK